MRRADPPARKERVYPHSSGDRNTAPGPDLADADTHHGGEQRDDDPDRSTAPPA